MGLGYIAEVPLVVINVMRGGPSTGLPTRVAQGDILQAKNPTHGDVKSITLMPGNLTECYTEVVRAFNLADRFMQPVFVLLDETIGHMAGKVTIPALSEVEKNIVFRKRFDGDKKDYLPYGVKEDEPAVLNPMFEGYRYHFTGLHHGATGHPTEDADTCNALMNRLFKKVENHTDELELNEEYMLEDAEILIIAYGSVSLGAKEAVNRLRKEGIKVGMFRPKTIWPSPEKRLNELVNKFEKVLVAELNMGQYSQEIERVSGRRDFDKLLKANGRPLSPLEIIEKVKGM
jgi:2-oxoglutarate/2-oxoacid ferredoxin oxidoreductase subunit alpha